MNDTKGTVPREKYREVLDQRNQFKNMWHNKCDELEGYKEYQSTPNENLRELVEEWREKESWYQQVSIRKGGKEASGKHTAYRNAREELEAVLEE